MQMAQTAGGRRDGSTKHGQESSSRGSLPPSQPSSARHQQRSSEPAAVAIAVAVTAATDERTLAEPVNQLAREFQTEREAFEHNARAVVEVRPPSPSSAKSVEELKTLKRQFASWKKEYEARLKKTKAELKRLVHAEKKSNGGGGGGNSGDGHAHQRRCGWWRFKAPKCRAPKCCSFKLPSPKSCCCCFRR
jgi:hypothetical protein